MNTPLACRARLALGRGCVVMRGHLERPLQHLLELTPFGGVKLNLSAVSLI